jgi:hypothetical protein
MNLLALLAYHKNSCEFVEINVKHRLGNVGIVDKLDITEKFPLTELLVHLKLKQLQRYYVERLLILTSQL